MKKMTARRIGYIAFVLAATLISYAALMSHPQQALYPYALMLEKLYGLSFRYLEIGYYFEQSNLVITPDCMGTKLFVSAFLMLSLGFPAPGGSIGKSFFTLMRYYGISLIGTFALTVIRIALSLPFTSFAQGQLIHNLLSLALYFGGLLFLYAFMQRRSGGSKARRIAG